MSNFKKLVCTLLTLAMLLGTLMMGTGAAYQDQDKIKHKEAVEKLASLNIMKGRDNGSFDPQAYVTRAEMCKMICYIYTGGKDFFNQNSKFQLPDKPTFSDTKGHWAEQYIEYCQNLHIFDGMGDGTFAPDATITGVQTAKMLLAVLGYEVCYEGMVGADWIRNTNVRAVENELYEGISSLDPSVALTRDCTAQMISNALAQRMINYEVIANTPPPQIGVTMKCSIPVRGFYTVKEVYFDGAGNPNDIRADFVRGESYSFHVDTCTLTDSYQGKEAPAGKTFLVAPLTARALVDSDKTAKVLLKDFELFIAIPGKIERQTFLPKASWQKTMMPNSFTLASKESFTYDLVFEVPDGSSSPTLVFVQKDANGVPNNYSRAIRIIP